MIDKDTVGLLDLNLRSLRGWQFVKLVTIEGPEFYYAMMFAKRGPDGKLMLKYVSVLDSPEGNGPGFLNIVEVEEVCLS